MSFSAHEMLIFLRARDEASRILARFARNAQGVNVKVLASNNKLIAGYQAERAKLSATSDAAKAASREKIAAINKTSNATRNGIRIQQKAMEAQRVAKTKEIIDYKQRKAAIEQMYAADQKQMYKMLRALRKQHEATKLTYDQEIVKIREVINKRKELLRLSDQRKLKEAQTSAKVIQNTDKEIRKYKELELAKKAENKAALIAARDKVAQTHKQVQALQSTGMALTTAGASAVASGVVTVNALSDAAQAAVDYRKAATSTLTQVDDKFKTTLEDIVGIGRKVASDFAVPIDEMQGAMYDLYSSMDVKNKKVAGNFMVEAAKAAVGGSTDIKTATNALISTLNSYELKVSDVNKVNDVMFQLVRKGVGSFGDFTNAMATANPSAHRAGQTYQTTAGMLALLTRNGIKSAKAGTSVARAFDAISNPKTAKNFKQLGMNIYDSQGKLKPMIKIVDMMKNSMKGLTQEQRSAKLKDMFAGSGGTIQALRFFNTALNDTTGSYKTLTDDMKNASNVIDENGKKVGAAAIAYQQMAGTDASKILTSQNQMAIAWQKVGDAIMPVKTAVFEFFGRAAEAWNKLSPQQQAGIAQFVAITAVVLIVGGAITTLIGIVMLMAAAFLALDAAALPIIAVVLAVIAVIALLAGAAYLVISNWGAISDFFKPFIDGLVSGWQHFADVFMGAFKQFDPVWKLFGDTIANVWQNILPYFQQGIDAITDMWNYWAPMFARVQEGFGAMQDKINPFITALANFAGIVGTIIGGDVVATFTVLGSVVAAVWRFITSVVANILPGLMALGAGLMGVIGGIMDMLSGIFTLDWNKFLSGIGQIFGGLVEMIIGILGTLGGAVWGIIKGVVDGIIAFFVYLYDVIVGHSIIPDLVNAIVSWIAGLPGQVLGFIGYLVNSAVSFFASMPGRILGAVGALSGMLRAAGMKWMANLLAAIIVGVSKVVSFIRGLPGKILSALGNVGSTLSNAGKSMMQGFLDGLRSIWNNIQTFVGDIASWISSHKGPVSYDYRLLQPHGKAVMGGFNKSLIAGMEDTKKLINGFTPTLGDIPTGISGSTTGYGSVMSGATITIPVYTREIDPIKNAADLGYEIANRLGL